MSWNWNLFVAGLVAVMLYRFVLWLFLVITTTVSADLQRHYIKILLRKVDDEKERLRSLHKQDYDERQGDFR